MAEISEYIYRLSAQKVAKTDAVDQRIIAAEQEAMECRSAIEAIKDSARKLGYDLRPTADGAFEFSKKDVCRVVSGDYLNPIAFFPGMKVSIGMWYTDGDNTWEAINEGFPESFADKSFFDIIG